MDYLALVFIADKKFFLPSVVAITSLLENKASDSKYKIYFVNVGFTEEQKKKIFEIEKKYKTHIIIRDVDEMELLTRYKDLVKHDCCASISALIKFDLPNICSNEDAVLYLDGDIIVQDDLSVILNEQFNERTYIKAVKDTGVLYSQTLIRQNVKDYFNSGVMYLNLAAMRRDNISELLVEEKYRCTDNSLMDQHVLNSVFENAKELLQHRYNVLYINLIRAHYFYGISIEQLNELMNTTYINWQDMFDKAAIIHYSSFDKPWKYSDVNGVELWDRYFKLSVVGEERLERKKLHIKLINKMRTYKATALFGSFIWECETKGIRLAIDDVIKFLRQK